MGHTRRWLLPYETLWHLSTHYVSTLVVLPIVIVCRAVISSLPLVLSGFGSDIVPDMASQMHSHAPAGICTDTVSLNHSMKSGLLSCQHEPSATFRGHMSAHKHQAPGDRV